MRIEETFTVDAAPEVVFDYVVDARNLPAWQTSTTHAEQITPGPPGLGTQTRERLKPPAGREFEQIVEFTEFDRPHKVHVHIVEGPAPIDGTWTFAPESGRTTVHFVAEGSLKGAGKLMGPVVSRAMARQFAGYHALLRSNVEAL